MDNRVAIMLEAVDAVQPTMDRFARSVQRLESQQVAGAGRAAAAVHGLARTYDEVGTAAQRSLAGVDRASAGMIRSVGGLSGASGGAQRALLGVGGAARSSLTETSGLFNKITSSIQSMATAGTSAIGNLMSMTLHWGSLAYGAVYGTGGALVKYGLTLNEQMDKYRITLATVLGSQAKANEMLEWMIRFAEKTPFQVQGLAESATMLESLGINAKKWLPLIGNVAAALGGGQENVQEMVRAIAMIRSGYTGHAFITLGRAGITRESLAKEGIRFEKSGEVASSAQEAMDALERVILKRYGNLMEVMSLRFTGMVSNIQDMLTNFLRSATGPLFDSLTNRLQGVIEWLNKMRDIGAIGYLAKQVGASLTSLFDRMVKFVGVDLWGALAWRGSIGDAFEVIFQRMKDPAERFILWFAETFLKTTYKVVSTLAQSWQGLAAMGVAAAWKFPMLAPAVIGGAIKTAGWGAAKVGGLFAGGEALAAGVAGSAVPAAAGMAAGAGSSLALGAVEGAAYGGAATAVQRIAESMASPTAAKAAERTARATADAVGASVARSAQASIGSIVAEAAANAAGTGAGMTLAERLGRGKPEHWIGRQEYELRRSFGMEKAMRGERYMPGATGRAVRVSVFEQTTESAIERSLGISGESAAERATARAAESAKAIQFAERNYAETAQRLRLDRELVGEAVPRIGSWDRWVQEGRSASEAVGKSAEENITRRMAAAMRGPTGAIPAGEVAALEAAQAAQRAAPKLLIRGVGEAAAEGVAIGGGMAVGGKLVSSAGKAAAATEVAAATSPGSVLPTLREVGMLAIAVGAVVSAADSLRSFITGAPLSPWNLPGRTAAEHGHRVIGWFTGANETEDAQNARNAQIKQKSLRDWNEKQRAMLVDAFGDTAGAGAFAFLLGRAKNGAVAAADVIEPTAAGRAQTEIAALTNRLQGLIETMQTVRTPTWEHPEGVESGWAARAQDQIKQAFDGINQTLVNLTDTLSTPAEKMRALNESLIRSQESLAGVGVEIANIMQPVQFPWLEADLRGMDLSNIEGAQERLQNLYDEQLRTLQQITSTKQQQLALTIHEEQAAAKLNKSITERAMTAMAGTEKERAEFERQMIAFVRFKQTGELAGGWQAALQIEKALGVKPPELEMAAIRSFLEDKRIKGEFGRAGAKEEEWAAIADIFGKTEIDATALKEAAQEIADEFRTAAGALKDQFADAFNELARMAPDFGEQMAQGIISRIQNELHVNIDGVLDVRTMLNISPEYQKEMIQKIRATIADTLRQNGSFAPEPYSGNAAENAVEFAAGGG